MCGKYALQGSSRALYIPLDPTHKECTWPVQLQGVGCAVLFGEWCSVAWWGDLIWWFDLTVVVCSDNLIWWYGLTLVCCGIGMRWPDVWPDCLVRWSEDLFHGLIWRSAWERWSGLTAENLKDNTSDEMAQLNVRELRKQKQRKKRKYFYFFKFSCNFEKLESLNRKRNQTFSGL